jgi:hypothetical protein
MGSSNLVEGGILIALVLLIIAIPYFCCQLSNEEYLKITTGIKKIKLEQLRKEAELKENRRKEGTDG